MEKVGFPQSLNGMHKSYPDDSIVWCTLNKRPYSVLSSFFLLNTENSYIICYLLYNNDIDKTFICPSVYVTDIDPNPAPNPLPNGDGGEIHV